MDKFEVVDNFGNVFAYQTLFDAYKSIDEKCEFIPVVEYISSYLQHEVKTAENFAYAFRQLVTSIANSMGNDTSDISKWYVLFSGKDEERDHPIFLKDTDNFISIVNHLLKSYDYDVTIRKSEEYVKASIKHFLEENQSEFLDIVNTLIEYQYYEPEYAWQRTKILNTENEDFEFDSDYNEEDSYNCLSNGVIYSATQANVLKYFNDDMLDIINIICNNEIALFNYGISSKLMNLMK